MKSVEDKVITAIIHGLIAAQIEAYGDSERVAERGIELAKKYLAGETIDNLNINDAAFVESTIKMVTDTFTDNATKQGYPNA